MIWKVWTDVEEISEGRSKIKIELYYFVHKLDKVLICKS